MSGDEKKEEKKDETVEDNPVDGVGYNFKIVKGIDGDRHFLSTTKDGTRCDLWPSDDQSGRQKWIVKKIGAIDGNPVYNITVYDGVFGDRLMLSAKADGTVVDLWSKDDSSGRQKWVFHKIGNDPKTDLALFDVTISGGINNDRKYLSSAVDGKKVDLWSRDDNSGRQQWVAIPLDMQVVGITYSDLVVLDQKPLVIADQKLINDSDKEQSMSFEVNKAVKQDYTWNFSVGTTVSVSAEGKVGLPLVAEGKVTTSVAVTAEFSMGKTESFETSYKYTFPVQVAANTTVRAVATVTEAVCNIGFTATLRSKLTGATALSKGVWNGVQTYSVVYKIEKL